MNDQLQYDVIVHCHVGSIYSCMGFLVVYECMWALVSVFSKNDSEMMFKLN